MLTCVRSENPKVAITSNSDISSWNTNADVVFDNSTNKLYFLDKAGCVTEDAAQAEALFYTNGNKTTYIPFIQEKLNALYNEIERCKKRTETHWHLINAVNNNRLPVLYSYDWWEE